MLGLGACLVLRARGADCWAAFALAAALLHTLNHAVFKALLFLGAGAFERAVGALELDRLGGLLRRMPWTGGAFLVGAMAIAGPAAAERVRLRVADLPGAAAHSRSTATSATGWPARSRSRRSRRPRRSRCSASSRSSASSLLGAAADEEPAAPRDDVAVADGAARSSSSPPACVVLGSGARACCSGRSPGSRPWRAAAPDPTSRPAPARDRLAADGRRSRSLLVGVTGAARARCAAGAARCAAPTWACGQLVGPALALDERGLHASRCGSCSRWSCGPSGRSRCGSDGRRRAGGRLQRARAAPDRRARLPAGVRGSRSAAAGRRGRLQSGSLGTYVAYLIAARAGAARAPSGSGVIG